MNCYNLLEERWIPVVWKNGDTKHIGIIEALDNASRIRCLALASPLDLFAIHRFIVTLLYWKASLAGGVERVRKLLLNDERIPKAMIDDIKKEAHRFNLFHEEYPFLQDLSVNGDENKGKEKKSIGSLFAELATGTNVAHFQHGDDENMRLCLPCTAIGMLRVIPWTQSGGSGLTPSVHNAPPIMAIAIGDNLAVTLGLNLVPLDVEMGKASWSGHFKPSNSTKPIPYLEALTWNPRRIFLPLPENGTCWYCGQSDVPTVGKIMYMKNENTAKRADKKLFEWQDPAAFYAAGFRTIKSTKEELAVSSRDLKYIMDNDSASKSTVLLNNPGHEGWLLVVPCTNPANNKTFDHRQIDLTELSQEKIRAWLHPNPPFVRQELNGWQEPERRYPSQGIKYFVQAAVRLLTYTDWAALSNAAYREMHESPAAFDVLSGLYWGLRDKDVKGLPSRNVAWLMLKLMAAVPANIRAIHPRAKFSPLGLLPKRQINELGRASPYPVSFPLGSRLEAALRGALDSNMRKRRAEPVDWIGFCHGLDQLLD